MHIIINLRGCGATRYRPAGYHKKVVMCYGYNVTTINVVKTELAPCRAETDAVSIDHLRRPADSNNPLVHGA
jgi:hypothetical protein